MLSEMLKDTLRSSRDFLTRSAQNELVAIKNMLIEEHLTRCLQQNPRYADPRRLNRYEFEAYSQCGEDGIIQEIFARIGTTNKFFIEFGIDNQIECNSIMLLLTGWQGGWIDGGADNVSLLSEKFAAFIAEKRLAIRQAFIKAENIEALLASFHTPKELDLLSIDIDGNDYWVWQAITSYRPRVVVIEYNAIFRPPVEFIVKYDPDKLYPHTSHFGASLTSLEHLGAEKGYKLVGCNYAGVNAFFVREDLVQDKFLAPFSAENHHEPPRFHLIRKTGHRRDFGEIEMSR